MTLRHLRIFVTVCQESSITKAAEKLYIAQPAVSFAIKELELHYNTPLFERLSRKLYLTPFGENVYNYAQRILALYSEMESQSESFQFKKIIRLGSGTTLASLFMPQIIQDFCVIHPDAEIYLTVNNASVVETLIAKNELDFAIMEGRPDLFPNISRVLIQKNEIAVICHKSHPLTQKAVVTAQDLVKENLLLREKESPVRQITDAFFYDHNLSFSPRWECMDNISLVNAVRKNLGISFIPANLIPNAGDGEVAFLNVADFHADRFINLVYHKDKILTPFMQEFIQFCKEALVTNPTETIQNE